MRSLLRLAVACLPMLALAETLVEQVSFGHGRVLSPNSFTIPGWSMLGEGHVPQILSDKVILTPPFGPNKRGAIWSQNKNTEREWAVDLVFRAGGADRASGNLQLWYVANGETSVGTGSIYTTGRFDGLGLVVDTNNGKQSIRGFLNDGTVDYRSHSNVDSLAFGHCQYNYRNLGRPSTIIVKSTLSGLEVLVDTKLCFSTNTVILPTDYTFGITAASADPPDSFEVFKFILKSTESAGYQAPAANDPIQGDSAAAAAAGGNPNSSPSGGRAAAQVAEISARLAALSTSLSSLINSLAEHTKAEEARYNEILSRLPSTNLISTLDGRLTNLDQLLTSLERELKASDHATQFAKLSNQLRETHLGVTEHLPNRVREYIQDHTPRIGFMIFSFIAFQSVLVVAYVLYKRRRSMMPKKFL